MAGFELQEAWITCQGNGLLLGFNSSQDLYESLVALGMSSDHNGSCAAQKVPLFIQSVLIVWLHNFPNSYTAKLVLEFSRV